MYIARNFSLIYVLAKAFTLKGLIRKMSKFFPNVHYYIFKRTLSGLETECENDNLFCGSRNSGEKNIKIGVQS